MFCCIVSGGTVLSCPSMKTAAKVEEGGRTGGLMHPWQAEAKPEDNHKWKIDWTGEERREG